MNSNILKTIHKNNRRSFGRKSHNRLQRDVIEDLNAYELSFEDWIETDEIEYQDDMDVSCDNDMMIDNERDDYENFMTPIDDE
jgi:hypothetical protein